MSRSKYIYVVIGKNGALAAAFTVKHELQSWLALFSHVEGFTVWRLCDARPAVPPVQLHLTMPD